MAFLKQLAEASAKLETHHRDPWYSKVEAAVRGKDTISTAALLDALRVPATTGTARRLADVMRDLHFVPLKSRASCPAAGAETPSHAAGPGRPRETKSSPTMKNTGAAGLNQQGMVP